MKRLLLFSILTLTFTVISLAQNTPSYLPTNGLVGWWPFNGNANDESGNGNNGTVNGATLILDRFGNVGKAYSFYGINDFIEIQTNNGNFDSQDYTLSFWFKSNVLPTSNSGGPNVNPSIISRLNIGGPSINGAASIWTIVEIGGSLYHSNSAFSTLSIVNGLLNNSWHNIIYTKSSGLCKTFVDGQFWSSNNVNGLIVFNNYPIRFGRSQHTYWKDFSGELDDIAIYNRALTPQEITALYTNTPPPTFFADTMGHIKCINCVAGDTGTVNGVVYTAVNRLMLDSFKNQGADLTKLCTSLVTDMSHLFENDTNFNQPIGNWDMHLVTSMCRMFYNARNFNQPIGNWDVSNVSNMSGTFLEAKKFNQNIGNWNVSSIIDFSQFLYNAVLFNQPLANWNVGNVLNMGQMFAGSSFNQPIGNWNVSNVQSMYQMFCNNHVFNQPLNGWNTISLNSLEQTFWGASSFNQPLNNWDVSNVITMAGLFTSSGFDQSISNWNVNHVEDMHYTFADSHFDQTIDNWDVSNVTDMRYMFGSNQSFNKPLSNWNVENVQNMEMMFANASSFNQPINNWCVLNIATEPINFSLNSPLIQNNKPIWGTCPKKLQVKVFFESYYHNNVLTSAMYNADGSSALLVCDTVQIMLLDSATNTIVWKSKTIVDTSGYCNLIIPQAYAYTKKYIGINHRGSIETWSANPVLLNSSLYDFTSSANKAMGNNLVHMGNGIYAIYSGDINQDGSVDFNDYPDLDMSSGNGDIGYFTTDLNGDASVDFNDYPILDINSSLGVLSYAPPYTQPMNKVALSTTIVSSITQTTATTGGNFLSLGFVNVLSRGICWGNLPNPTVLLNATGIVGSGVGTFSYQMNNLNPATTYYVRAFAITANDTVYGNEISFKTQSLILGQNYAGGIVFYIDGTGQHGMVCSTADQGQLSWGCTGTSIGNTSVGFGAGAANSISISNICSSANSAAKTCKNLLLNGYSDWYLPSRAELALIRQNLYLNGWGALSNTNYWSSSEFSANNAWLQNFSNGNASNVSKSNSCKVRAIRTF